MHSSHVFVALLLLVAANEGAGRSQISRLNQRRLRHIRHLTRREANLNEGETTPHCSDCIPGRGTTKKELIQYPPPPPSLPE